MASPSPSRVYPVDIEAGDRIVQTIAPFVKASWNPGTLFSGFGGCQVWSEEETLVTSTDSLGSKILVALAWGKLRHVGYDLVNHCINDILVQGAEPVAFMDYVATSRIDAGMEKKLVTIIKSVADACQARGVPLVGGETAEINGMYCAGAVDLVGMIVGKVPRSRLVTGEGIQADDMIYGFPSSGLHTNGYSLVYKHIEQIPEKWKNELMKPHRCYLDDVKKARSQGVKIKGLLHITGGGWVTNPQRVLPNDLKFDMVPFKIPPLFQWAKEFFRMGEEEAFKVFNMGIGFVIITDGPVKRYPGAPVYLGNVIRK